jgi:hypothetical protein
MESTVEHVVIYREPGRFAGWPANYGMWSWGDEIVLVFTSGHLNQSAEGFHAVDPAKPFTTMQARSTNGGRTWSVGPFTGATPGDGGLSVDEHLVPELRAATAIGPSDSVGDLPDKLDFTGADFALMCARTGLHRGAMSWFYTSNDRCGTWQGPYRLPSFGVPGLAARTDYVALGATDAVFLLTAAKSDGQEGRVFATRTRDGARSFQPPAWVGDEPAGFAIMPATVRLESGRLLTAIRCADSDVTSAQSHHWIDLYASNDDGAGWSFAGRPVPDTGRGGNPATLTLLPDARLCLVYGFRDPPYGIRARISEDDGSTWSDEIVLRADAAVHDLGYPRTVPRADGALVSAYYYNDRPSGERYIGATIWKP